MKLGAELKRILSVGKPSVREESPNRQAGRVLVLDGADVVGYRVVERLIDAGYADLRVGSRTMHAEKEIRAVDMVHFIWEDEDTYAAALKDVKTVFVTLPIKPTDWDRHFPRFLKACIKHRVTQIVKLSFFHAINAKTHSSQNYGYPDTFASHYFFRVVPFVHAHALCDGDLILHKELDVTILNATHLMSNIFRYGFQRIALKDKREFYGASRGEGVGYVSPNDVAEVAVKAILEKTHKRQAYTLTGPAAITDAKVAALLAERLGTKITYIEKPLNFFDSDKATLESIKAKGLEVNFSKGDIKKVIGRKAESFADYLKRTDLMTPVEYEVFSSHFNQACSSAKDVVEQKEAKEDIKERTETRNVSEEKEETTEEDIGPTETEEEFVEKERHVDAPQQAAHEITDAK